MNGVFVTGTDTDVGKTVIANAIVAGWRQRSLEVAVMKPVSAGCEQVDGFWRNADAVSLLASSGRQQDYSLTNPYAFAPAIAPHIAAAEAGVEISIPLIMDAFRKLTGSADRVVVEGAGGVLVPLGTDTTVLDLMAAMQLPAVLVVGVKLGCLNHAALSVAAIRSRGLELAGWVANLLDGEMARCEENLATLAGIVAAPCLGTVPQLADCVPDEVAGYLDFDTLASTSAVSK